MTDPTAGRYYITTSIPYVNGTPHIGFSLEVIQCDALARFHRLIGDDTRYHTGTDENALTNLQAADKAGEPIQQLVDRNAERFASIREPLNLSTDVFFRTSTDPLHFPGAQKLWRAMDAADDIYTREYQGLYCVRCERFYKPEELVNGNCPIHEIPPEPVDEVNYFFRLSKYGDQLRELIASNALLVQPEHRREEILSFIESGLEDISISRQALRGRGWGVPVPDDPDQVMYVWVDALSNYITALDYAGDGPDYERYWTGNPNRVHVIGKDIIRFHVVYWPAFLLSAGLPLPSVVNVHEFLMVDGEKISKSRGNTVDPVEIAALYGRDALRYWLLREMPRTGDGNFSHERLISRYNEDLGNDLGNLVNRSVSMLHRYRDGVVPRVASVTDGESPLAEVADGLGDRIQAAFDAFDFRQAIAAAWELVSAANKYIDDTKPWELAKAAKNGGETANDRLDVVLADLIETIRLLAVHLSPFIPDGAEKIANQVGFELGPVADDGVASRTWNGALADTALPKASPIFPKIEVEAEVEAPA
ncbi:MAG: methionine--tRNA ligase [Chloroflexota bacterium]|nr:methionine--tRNA ligase [Chloroflexota bacterium]